MNLLESEITKTCRHAGPTTCKEQIIVEGETRKTVLGLKEAEEVRMWEVYGNAEKACLHIQLKCVSDVKPEPSYAPFLVDSLFRSTFFL